jgi:hypothetical protein
MFCYSVFHAVCSCFRHCLYRQKKFTFFLTLLVKAHSNQDDVVEVRGKATGNGSDLTSKKRMSPAYVTEHVQILGLWAHFTEPEIVLEYTTRKRMRFVC